MKLLNISALYLFYISSILFLNPLSGQTQGEGPFSDCGDVYNKCLQDCIEDCYDEFLRERTEITQQYALWLFHCDQSCYNCESDGDDQNEDSAFDSRDQCNTFYRRIYRNRRTSLDRTLDHCSRDYCYDRCYWIDYYHNRC